MPLASMIRRSPLAALSLDILLWCGEAPLEPAAAVVLNADDVDVFDMMPPAAEKGVPLSAGLLLSSGIATPAACN